jgi:hypothetical protein
MARCLNLNCTAIMAYKSDEGGDFYECPVDLDAWNAEEVELP